ncbi:hypothetical protein ACP70R_014937 [Stipagrostis hirtigluma subsp. patula]
MSRQLKSTAPEIVNMGNLFWLDLCKNQLSRRVPSQIGHLNDLTRLDLSHNKLSGAIPEELVNMCCIIQQFGRSCSKRDPQASINWFLHSKGLCSAYFGLSPCYSPTAHKDGKKHRNFISAIGFLLLISLLSAITVFFIRQKRKPEGTAAACSRGVFSISNSDGRLAFEDIINATENFDGKYCVGGGGYGNVYKAPHNYKREDCLL